VPTVFWRFAGRCAFERYRLLLGLYNTSPGTIGPREGSAEPGDIVSVLLIALRVLVVSCLLTFVAESSTLCVSVFIVLLSASTSVSRILFALLGSNIFVCLYPSERGSSNPGSSREL
jgi:hypothetical protein